MGFEISKNFKLKYANIVVIVCINDFCFVQDDDARLLYTVANKVLGHNGQHSINIFEKARLKSICNTLVNLHIDLLVIAEGKPIIFKRFSDNSYNQHLETENDDYYAFNYVIKDYLKKYSCSESYGSSGPYYIYSKDPIPESLYKFRYRFTENEEVIIIKGRLPISKLIDLSIEYYYPGNLNIFFDYSYEDNRYSRRLSETERNKRNAEEGYWIKYHELEQQNLSIKTNPKIERICRNCGKYGTEFCTSSRMNCSDFSYIR